MSAKCQPDASCSPDLSLGQEELWGSQSQRDTVRETMRVDMTDDSDTARCPQALQASPALFGGTASFALGALGITPSAANLEVGFGDRIYLFF